MAKSKSTKSRALNAKAAETITASLRKVNKRLDDTAKLADRAAKQGPAAAIWDRLDDLHTRLFTLYSGIYYIGDHAPDDVSSAFYMLGKSIEHEYNEVGAMLHRRTDMPKRAAS